MDESGAFQRVTGPALLRTAARVASGADWSWVGASVRGPLLTLATAIVFDVLARNSLPIAHPFPILVFTTVYSTYSGGLRPGLISALITMLYALHYLSEPGSILRYTPTNAYSFLAISVAVSLTVLLVARLQGAARGAHFIQLSRQEAERVDRRLAFFAEANAVLASSLDYTNTLRDLSRLIVPTLADWCAIHVATEQGTLQFISGAHRDPSKDLLVRALCEYGSARPPFGTPHRGAEMGEVTDAVLRTRAEDPEQLKLFRALSPTAFIGVPMLARGQNAGTITLVVSTESGRSYEADDLAFAQELASRAALPVDNARLYDAAQEADERYGMLFENNPQPMWVFDVETLEFIEVNDAAVRHYGYSRDEFVAITIMDILPSEDAPGLHHGLEGTGAQRGDVALAQHQRKDGTIIDMELVSHEMELDGRRTRLVLGTDITERTRTRAALHQSEEQLRQAQRTDVAGRLAGGVAHDFNNLLSVIGTFSSYLLDDVEEGRARSDLQAIQGAVRRGAELTRQLLLFSGRRPAEEPESVSVTESLENVERLLRPTIGKQIDIDFRLEAPSAFVAGHGGHLEQIVMNLALNARDAMPEGGRMAVAADVPSAAELGADAPGLDLDRSYIRLSVEDSGSGMSPAEAARAMEPFFTTKAKGEGTGLGLASVYGIARQLEGNVVIDSAEGRGTTVRVYLPAETGERAVSEGGGMGLRRPSAEMTPVVLLVEDDADVREGTARILSRAGYAVIPVADGEEGLSVLAASEAEVDVALIEVVLPGMSGLELARRIREEAPQVPIVHMSGSASSIGAEPVVEKPFPPDRLVAEIHRAMSGGGIVPS